MADNAPNPADDIRVLTGIEAARLMPGMYIGGTDQRALHTVVRNLIGHAIFESMNRPGNQISVTIEPGNTVRVTDDGLGLPVTPDQWTGRPLIERVLSTHWAGTRWPGREKLVPHRHSMYYVGLFVSVALAEKITVDIKQQGYLWRIIYSKGERQTELERIAELADPTETGTTITFQPDYTIFQPVDIDHEYMYRSLRELAFLMNQFTVTFEDKRPGAAHPSHVFQFSEGTADFVRYLNRDQKPLHDPVMIRKSGPIKVENVPDAKIEIDLAVQYTDSQQFMILSYVNGVEVKNGGVHVQGFLEGWSGVINTAYNQSTSEPHQWTFITENETFGGMTAVISIWYQYPSFEGASTRKLSGAEVKTSIERLVRESMYNADPATNDLLTIIVAKCLKNRTEHVKRRYGN